MQMFYDGQSIQNMGLQLLYSLLDLFPDGLIRIHKRLLVDYDLSCVGLWSTNSRCNCRRICFHDNPVNIVVSIRVGQLM